MPANPPAKIHDAPPERPADRKLDPFRPEMPKIPGVKIDAGHDAHSSAGMPSKFGIDPQQMMKTAGLIAAMILVVGALFWWSKTRSRGAATAGDDWQITEPAASTAPLAGPLPSPHDGPTVAASVEELSKPWAYKKFVFVKPFSGENVEAVVIRLPGEALWAFALQGPYDHCKLEFVTNLEVLASRYHFEANHPMVVSPCNGTVYDPLKVGPLGVDTWARGEIVRGSSLRPPIAIDVKVSGSSIIADGIE